MKLRLVVPLTAALTCAGIPCGEDVAVGAWYPSYSGGPRWAKISIKDLAC